MTAVGLREQKGEEERMRRNGNSEVGIWKTGQRGPIEEKCLTGCQIRQMTMLRE